MPDGGRLEYIENEASVPAGTGAVGRPTAFQPLPTYPSSLWKLRWPQGASSSAPRVLRTIENDSTKTKVYDVFAVLCQGVRRALAVVLAQRIHGASAVAHTSLPNPFPPRKLTKA